MSDKQPLIIAIYLPQFHETEFNNTHWESGYTEWTACRRAKQLFDGHRQPREPLENRYYDLSRIENIKYQSDLAKHYGIDGFAVYHYYSCGEKLLNKPMELLLEHPEVDFPFYFFWANESWRKNWFGQDKNVIWPQVYGTENDWIVHYEYCSRFFNDSRYLKYNNKPVFFIYQPWQFEQIDAFIDLWNELSKKEGYDGVFFVKNVTARTTSKTGHFDAVFERQPFFELGKGENLIKKYSRLLFSRIWEYTNRIGITKHLLWRRDYAEACRKIIKMKPSALEKTILGVFSGWDNTPRKGYSGCLFENESADVFEKCLIEQIKKAQKYGCPQIVINAWNEWAEGMYIEPDKTNGYRYLEGVKRAKVITGLIQ